MQNDPNLRADVSKTFTSDRVSKINSLFNNIYMKEVSSSFEFYTLIDDLKLEPDQISSGESEAVSLCSEIMYFFDTLHEDKSNVLILDEPDVHLHPDLQYHLSRMILSIIGEYSEVKDNYSIFISTHSSSIISSFVDCNFCSIGTKHFGCDVVELKKFSSSLQKMGPLIGHSLSLYLSKDTPLILEGEDDDRVWQQVCRSSEGEIRLFPVVASSVSVQFNLEKSCSDLMQALYGNPVAISIRDGDGSSSKDMQDIGVVKRFALRCYEIENILVTDECLKNMNQTWGDFIVLVNKFIAENPNHQHKQILIELLSSKDRLRHKKIKSIRNLIVGICGVSRPWEVVVGQTIASKLLDVDYRTGMLVDFMGKEFLSEVYRAKDWGCV